MIIFQFWHGPIGVEDLEHLQLDVKMVFLHGNLNEDIYTEQLKGFVSHDQERLHYQHKQSMYGLKQAPRHWYWKFDDFLEQRTSLPILERHI